MRSLWCALLLGLLAGSASGQLKPGQLLLNASFQGANSAQDLEGGSTSGPIADSDDLDATFQFLVQTSSKGAWGLEVGYDFIRRDEDFSSGNPLRRSTVQGYSIGPTHRRLFSNTPLINVYTDLSLTYRHATADADDFNPGGVRFKNTDGATDQFNLALRPGAQVKAAKNLVVTLSFELFRASMTDETLEITEFDDQGSVALRGEVSESSFDYGFFPGFSLGSLAIGVQLVLGKGRE
ncbi:MAG: hypothetical protein SFY70_05565 [Bacteroidia bacterium]|nr:hypothetical protein [Bacteroidia bacterium]